MMTDCTDRISSLNSGDVVAELPFILMHPKPPEESKNDEPSSLSNHNTSENPSAVDHNLIQLDETWVSISESVP